MPQALAQSQDTQKNEVLMYYRIRLLRIVAATLLLSLGSPFLPIARSLESLVAQAPAAQDQKAKADELSQKGVQQYQGGQLKAALQSLQQALTIYRELKDRQGEGQALKNLGNAYLVLGENDKAIASYQQSLKIAQQIRDRDLEARSLNNLGNAYKNLKDFAKAIEYYQQSLKIARDNQNRNVEGIALRNLGDTYNTLEEYNQAIEYYKQYLSITPQLNNRETKRQVLAVLAGLKSAYDALGDTTKGIEVEQQILVIAREMNNRLSEGFALLNLGGGYHDLGNHSKALEFYQQALAISKKFKEPLLEVDALEGIGSTYLQTGKTTEAIEYLHQSLAIAQTLKRESQNSKVKELLVSSEKIVLAQLRTAYLALGNYAKAIEYQKQDLAIAGELNDPQRKGKALQELGVIYLGLNDFVRGIEHLEQSLAIAQEIDNLQMKVQSLDFLGLTYFGLGYFDKALEYVQQNLATVRAFNNRQTQKPTVSRKQRIVSNYFREKEALFLSQIADFYFYGSAADVNKVVDYSWQSLRLARKLKFLDGQKVALTSLAHAYFALKDQRKAINYLEQALALTTDKFNNPVSERADRQQNGLILLNLGMFYADLGEHTKAMEYLRQGLAIIEESGNLFIKSTALAMLGNALAVAGNLSEAEKVLREAIKDFESVRAGLGDKDAYKVSFSEFQSDPYVLLQQVLIAQNQPNAALEIAERGRARAFVELLASRLPPDKTNQSTIPSPTIEQIKQIAKAQNATLVEYSITSGVKPIGNYQESKLFIWVIKPTGEIKFHSVALKPLLQRQNTSLNDLVTNTHKSILESVSVSSRGAGQQLAYVPGNLVRLKDDEESGLKEPWQVIKVDSNRAMLLLTHPQFDDGVQIQRPIRDVIAKVESSRTNQQQLQNLHQLLIAPIADLLPTNPDARVIFVPQGELFLTPFAALQDSNGKYLIEKHAMLIAPSIQVLELTHKKRNELRGKKLGSALVMGNPTMPTIPLTKPPQQLSSLPEAEAEAKAIASLLNTQAILGKQATKVTIVPQMERAGLIHLATHGLLDDFKQLGVPGAIALAPSNEKSDPYSGFLTSGDILGLKLNAELVVLSACNTGQGRITGDGVIGLSRSLMVAGVPSAIVSLWSVPDAPTAELMSEFYQNYLRQGMNKAQALRQAMLTTKKKHPIPRDWAAFTLIGEAE